MVTRLGNFLPAFHNQSHWGSWHILANRKPGKWLLPGGEGSEGLQRRGAARVAEGARRMCERYGQGEGKRWVQVREDAPEAQRVGQDAWE